MTGTTPRFGLTTLNEGDDLTADDYAFGRANRLRLDRIITEVIENHEHTGVAVPTSPGAPPSLALTSGGVLPANRSIFYRVALVDAKGQEYVASQQATIVTPAAVTVPNPPSLSQSLGGVLQAGEYLYQLTAYTGSTGYETTASRSAKGTLTEGNQWLVALPALPSGATGWNIYRKSPTDLEPVYLVSVTNASSWLDTGAVKPLPYRTPPVENTTASTSAVTVSVGAIPAGCTLKIYRTLDQSDWSRSFVARVATGTFLDTGHATQTGAPLARNLAFSGAPKIRLSIDTEGVLPPGLLTHSQLATFAFAGPVEPGISPWLWVCEVDQAAIYSVRASLGRDSVPAAMDVTVRLEYKTPSGSWTPVLAPSSAIAEFRVPVGLSVGTLASVGDEIAPTALSKGDALRAVVTSTGGGATPTDSDLSVVVTMLVRHGSATSSYTWKED